MIDRRRHPRLALEALAEIGVARAVGREDLQRDGPAEVELLRAVDDAHPAAADHGLDAAACEDGTGGELAHPCILKVRTTIAAMPTYVYLREDGTTIEIQQAWRDDALTTCPDTGKPVIRVLQPFGSPRLGKSFYEDAKRGAETPAAD
jgi:predicted nucleic acid-binding Zn ribbon protein